MIATCKRQSTIAHSTFQRTDAQEKIGRVLQKIYRINLIEIAAI